MKQNHKLLALILAICLCLSMLSSCNVNNEYSNGLEFAEVFVYFSDGLTPDEYEVIGIGKCTDNEISIPPTTPEGKPVTGIRFSAFVDCVNITSVTIPDSVEEIGDSAFKDCSGLINVVIPNSVEAIGAEAFKNCTELANLVIPNSVKYIGKGAFEGCDNLISIENGVSYVDKWVVDCNTSATNVELRSDTLGICGSLFSNFISLTSVNFGENSQLTSISYSAFENCTSLRNITIPDGVTSIGSSAFEGCSSLTSVNFGENSQITSIGNMAFYNCSSLTSISIPDSVTSIGEGTFAGCSSLTSITIPDSVTIIGRSAFFHCSSLTTVNYTGTEDDWAAIEGIKDICLPSTATIVYNYTPEE